MTNERFLSYREADAWLCAILDAVRDDPSGFYIFCVARDAFDYGNQRELIMVGDAMIRMGQVGMNDKYKNRVYLACGLVLLAVRGIDT